MTNQQILEKAIQKAINGGWKFPKLDDGSPLSFTVTKDNVFVVGKSKTGATYDISFAIETIIFNHDFAKALWGEMPVHMGYRKKSFKPEEYELRDTLPMWQVALQQMVIADDPIKYLGANL